MTKSNMGFQLESTYLSLPPILYTVQRAKPVSQPQCLLINEALAHGLGLDADLLNSEDGAQVLSGNSEIEGSTSFAQAYSGHQFGYFNHLGDGRALVLGEHLTPSGERYDIQLKGSGPTPYSRRGDGRATLSAMLREYLISEAIWSLGIPSTRSLSVVATGEKVYREYVHDGAILTRVASSHIRVGTFQWAASQGDVPLRALFDYTFERHYKGAKGSSKWNHPAKDMLFEFANRHARLIALWQSVGFVHGVMNTDNVTLSGETIDYGPCAFIDQYDPDSVFSAIDTGGRYRLKHQPLIGKWNLARFAETLLPLLGSQREGIANEALEHFDRVYAAEFLSIMQKKLGLLEDHPENASVIQSLLNCMANDGLDYSDTFVKLTLGTLPPNPSETFAKWHEAWMGLRQRQSHSLEIQREVMKAHNPTVIPRNHLVEEALTQWTVRGNRQPFMSLLDLLKTPYAYTSDHLEKGAAQDSWPKNYTTTCGT